MATGRHCPAARENEENEADDEEEAVEEENAHEHRTISDILVALQLARSRNSDGAVTNHLPQEIISLQQSLQNFPLAELLEALQRERDAGNYSEVRDLQEAAILNWTEDFVSLSDTGICDAMEAARSNGDRLQILALQRIINERENERTRAGLQLPSSDLPECPICRGSLNDSDSMQFSNACEHVLHRNCLRNMAESHCVQVWLLSETVDQIERRIHAQWQADADVEG